MKSVYKKLVSFHEAVKLAKQTIMPIAGTEKLPITECSGRILSQALFAPRNNPPFNRSTMDGYAVRARDLEGVNESDPAILRVVGESFIGQQLKRMEGERCCFRISTGAIIPEGADAVVKVESTEDLGNDKIRISESVTHGTNIAEAGSDISAHELLLLAGKEIDTNDIAVLASLGIPEIEVYRKLKVSVLSTGNELISHTEPYREGSINDANGVALCNELSSYRFIEASYAGIARDDYDEIKGKIEKNLVEADLVILSGGSSAGESDLVYRIIDDMVPGMVFHGVLVKPGLPTVLGKSADKVVIGLPGFPVSSMMIFRSVFLQAILKAGRSEREINVDKGNLAVNLKLEMGKQNLVPVTVSGRAPRRVYPVTGLSGSISRFISTSGFISLEGNTKFLEAGTEVEIMGWSQNIEDNRPLLSGIASRIHSDKDATGFLTSMRYHRMSPRDSLKSLVNHDSAISTFYFTGDFPIHDYVRSEMGNVNYFLYTGKVFEIGLECHKPVKSLEEVFELLELGETISGPAVRFLESIASDSKMLERLIRAIKNNLSSYIPSGLYSEDKNTSSLATVTICLREDAAKRKSFWLKVMEIMPAYLTLDGDFLSNKASLKENLTALKR